MIKRRQITGIVTEEASHAFKEYGIECNPGVYYVSSGLHIDDDLLFNTIRPIIGKYNLHIYDSVYFSNSEILSSDYCVLTWLGSACGYPKPDSNFGYINLTYDISHYCPNCGNGLVQKAPFRIGKIPNKKLSGIGWVYDEIFVQKDAYDEFFKPFGISFWNTIRAKQGVLDNLVQLKIPVTEELLDMTDTEYTICKRCGKKKYSPKIKDFLVKHKNPVAPLFKGAENYGSGHSSHRFIYINAEVRDILLKNKLIHINNLIPCR